MKGNRTWAFTISAFSIVIGVGVVLLGRTVRDGQASLAAADQAIRGQDWATATERAREAASAYFPGTSHGAAAFTRLVHVARMTEAQGDTEAAFFAWRALHDAALQTHWLAQPYAYELAMANAALVRLSKSDLHASDKAPSQFVKRMIREPPMYEDQLPRAAWVLVLVATFGATIGSVMWILRRRVTTQ